MAQTWVISDTHFRHGAILTFKDYAGKPPRTFDSVDHMDQCMMDNWNDMIKPEDTVYWRKQVRLDAGELSKVARQKISYTW